jgi:hypothetical protein
VLWEYITNPEVSAFSRVKRAKTAPDAEGVETDADILLLAAQQKKAE